MKHRTVRTVVGVLVLAMGSLGFGQAKPSPATAPSTVLATRPTTRSAADAEQAVRRNERLAEGIALTEKYYAELYAKPLSMEKDARLAHLIAVVSLSRIDGPALTDQLMEVLKINTHDALVLRFAWEALNARSGSLSPEQQDGWLAAGLASAQKAFPGETAAPLIAALSSRPLDAKRMAKVKLLFSQIANENDPSTPSGKLALETAAAALATWSEPALVEHVIRLRPQSPEMARRVDLLLSKLPDPPASDANSVVARWMKWLVAGHLKPPQTLPSYTGKSLFFPPAEKITDPHDPKWKKESELGNLRISQLDAAICIDGTGSMATSNDFVIAYLETALRTFQVITPSVRAGVVYYRHENQPQTMLACCTNAASNPKNFTVRMLPLTGRIPVLVRTMKAQIVEPKQGHDGGGGAYFSGVTMATRMLGPKKKDAVRVIIATGDTYLTSGSKPHMEKLAKELKESGIITSFLVQTQKASNNLKSSSQFAGGKDPFVYDPDLAALAQPHADPLELFEQASFGKVAKHVMASVVPPAYADRVDTIFPYIVRAMLAEARAARAREKAKR